MTMLRKPPEHSSMVAAARRPQVRHHARSRRIGHVLVIAAGFAGLALLAAGCGGGSRSPAVASLGTTTSAGATSTTGGGNTKSTSPTAAALASCFTSHGFTAAVGSGGIAGTRIKLPGIAFSGNADPGSPQFRAAMRACRKYLPGGGPPSLTPAEQAEIRRHLVALAECTRKHGVPDFPDPNGQGQHDLSGVDQGSPRFQGAMKACEPSGAFRVGRVEVP
jgi:hypothetical protein